MAVRMKRAFRGKDGGKHPHNKNAQDYPREIPDHAAALRTAAQQAGWLITWHAERADVLSDERVQAALAALGEVWGMK